MGNASGRPDDIADEQQATEYRHNRDTEALINVANPQPQPRASAKGILSPQPSTSRQGQPTLPTLHFQGLETESQEPTTEVLDPILLQEIKGFVYHEPELVVQIRNTMQELVITAENIKAAKESIKTSTDDLMHTYQQTLGLFRNRSSRDPNVKTAISILQENYELQDRVSEGFMKAADVIHHATNKLKTHIDKITVPVLGRNPQ